MLKRPQTYDTNHRDGPFRCRRATKKKLEFSRGIFAKTRTVQNHWEFMQIFNRIMFPQTTTLHFGFNILCRDAAGLVKGDPQHPW